jgi:hypothetical protein
VSVALSVLGVLACLVGGVWIFQGIGVLKGSFMTGSAFWGWTGTLTAAGGLALLSVGSRIGRRS